MSSGIYVEGFKDLPSGDKELITATIETDLALRMLIDHLGLEFALEPIEEQKCFECNGHSYYKKRDVFAGIYRDVGCVTCSGTGKIQGKPVIRKKK